MQEEGRSFKSHDVKKQLDEEIPMDLPRPLSKYAFHRSVLDQQVYWSYWFTVLLDIQEESIVHYLSLRGIKSTEVERQCAREANVAELTPQCMEDIPYSPIEDITLEVLPTDPIRQTSTFEVS